MTPIFDEIRAKDLAEWAGRADSELLTPSLIEAGLLSESARDGAEVLATCRRAHEAEAG